MRLKLAFIYNTNNCEANAQQVFTMRPSQIGFDKAIGVSRSKEGKKEAKLH